MKNTHRTDKTRRWINRRYSPHLTVWAVFGYEVIKLISDMIGQPVGHVSGINHDNRKPLGKVPLDKQGKFLAIDVVVDADGGERLGNPVVIGKLVFHRVGKAGRVDEVNHAPKVAKKGRK